MKVRIRLQRWAQEQRRRRFWSEYYRSSMYEGTKGGPVLFLGLLTAAGLGSLTGSDFLVDFCGTVCVVLGLALCAIWFGPPVLCFLRNSVVFLAAVIVGAFAGALESDAPVAQDVVTPQASTTRFKPPKSFLTTAAWFFKGEARETLRSAASDLARDARVMNREGQKRTTIWLMVQWHSFLSLGGAVAKSGQYLFYSSRELLIAVFAIRRGS